MRISMSFTKPANRELVNGMGWLMIGEKEAHTEVHETQTEPEPQTCGETGYLSFILCFAVIVSAVKKNRKMARNQFQEREKK